MKRHFIAVVSFLFLMNGIIAQETFPVNGVQDYRPGTYAFTNARVYVDYKTVMEAATLLIEDGKVVALGTDVTIPAGYITKDLKGKTIYPGLVEIWSDYGMPKPDRSTGRSFNRAEQINSSTKGPYNANEAIKAEFAAAEVFQMDDKAAAGMRKLGFGSTQTLRKDGLARGTSALVSLGTGSDNELVLHHKVGAQYSFAKGTSTQDYPVSTMGFIALLRQTYLDGQWYSQFDHPPFTDITLNAWLANQSLPQFFEVSNWVTVLRADKLGDEFGVQYIIKGEGDAYKRIEEIKKTGASLIVPINFPDALDVSNPLENHHHSLADLKHWEMAPGNLAALEAAGIPFAITADGLSKSSDFWPNLKKAVKRGLSEEGALKALLHTPAQMMGVKNVGHLNPGAEANFIITSESIFADEAKIHENWIAGKRFEIEGDKEVVVGGQYQLTIAGESFPAEITGKKGKWMTSDSAQVAFAIEVDGAVVTLTMEEPSQVLTGWVDGKDLMGNGISWSAKYEGPLDAKKDQSVKEEAAEEEAMGAMIYPFVAYGRTQTPAQHPILFKNATVWTMEADDDVRTNTDVLIENGQISKIGENLRVPRDAKVVDATGLHLTPGIIDEHSHIGASSINDVATNSGMVRIGDVINPEDQEIYRALAGGVTAVQILHGSANPIGGQSALIKLRWGSGPEAMKIESADGFIKFALGENVKRSRSESSIRFPQTRMGVEQVYVDAFSSARDYLHKWEAYDALSDVEKAAVEMPRRDLALETMGEILNKERFISCHSYVQSEINMLMKVAEQFDFRINTFTHILEGYKVADKMAAHGVGASTFSDWWNYKWEVRYAIAYNAAIMHREGVLTAINSDDAEMMRRLNQEAAKVVKYGGVSEWDALKMVTINPAKLLHLDDRMGSIKVGKDADLVLWSDHPLSIYAQPIKTLVDGRVLYDREEDQELKAAIAAERARIMEKMKAVKNSGGKTVPGRPAYKHHFHCDDVVEIR